MGYLNASVSKNPAARSAMGIALMSVASLVVPLVDGMAKLLGASHSPFLVAWARYATASLLVLPLSLLCYRSADEVRRDFVAHALRTVLTVAAMTCFFFAITDIPLATAFGGYFLGPVVAALVAAPVLGEPLTPVRLGAAGLGLVGAVLIVRPGVDVQFGSFLAMLSGLCFAGYLITTRLTAATTLPLDALRFQCVFGALLLTPVALWHWSWPTRTDLLLIAAMGGISALCHLMVIAAFRCAGASVLAPLAYLELVTATLFGQLVFAELPDGLAFLSVAIIVMSGLLIWRSESRRGKPGDERGAARLTDVSDL
jgi:drug/metabolite transporter (DMT)-like permease